MNSFVQFFQQAGAEAYELPHQLMIAHLAEYPAFRGVLTGTPLSGVKVKRETHKGLFDISFCYGQTGNVHFEIKTRSGLGGHQIRRQLEHVKKDKNCELKYILLGTIADEWPTERFQRLYPDDSLPDFLGYEHLIKACRKLVGTLPKAHQDLDLANDYCQVLQEQLQKIQDADQVSYSEARDKKKWYYARFRRIRKTLTDWKFMTKTGDQKKDKGFTLHQLNGWVDYKHDGVKAQLLLEIIDNELCVRAHTLKDQKENREVLRSHLQEQLKNYLKVPYNIRNSNHGLSDYMKVVRILLPKEEWLAGAISIETCCRLLKQVKKQMEQMAEDALRQPGSFRASAQRNMP